MCFVTEGQIAPAKSLTRFSNAEYRRENLVHSKIKKEEYDGILYNSAFHHILKQDRNSLLKKMHSGLKSFGRLLLITRVHPDSKELFIEAVKLGKQTQRIASRSTKEELFELVQDSGFSIERKYYAEPHPDDPEGIFQHLLLKKTTHIV